MSEQNESNGGDASAQSNSLHSSAQQSALHSSSSRANPATATTSIANAVLKQTFLDSEDEQPRLKWTVWIQLFEDHLLANGLENLPDNRKLAALRSSLGVGGYKICSELCLPTHSYNETVEILRTRFSPRASQIFNRYKFNSRQQQSNESCQQFVTALRTLSASCGYPDTIRDQLIRDRLVVGCSSSIIRERILLEEDQLTLEQALHIAQSSERATSETALLSKSNSSHIHAISTKQSSRPAQQRDSRSQQRSPSSTRKRSPSRFQRQPSQSRNHASCGNCGGQPHSHDKCPGFKIKCHNCGRIGHFANMCRSRGKANNLQNSPKSSHRVSVIRTVTSDGESQFKYLQCIVASKPVLLLIDLGAKVSILNRTFIDSLNPRPKLTRDHVNITSYTGNAIHNRGTTELPVRYHTRELLKFPFVIVDNGENLMGVDLFDALGFSIQKPETVASVKSGHTEMHDRLLAQYPSLLHSTREQMIKGFTHYPRIDPTVPPKAQKFRRIPLALNDEVCAEIKRMEHDGVLERIESSPWISNMVFVRKPTGKLRICCDLSDVNKAIIPDKYPLPTIEELSESFAGASLISKIDLKGAYLQVDLDPEIRYITAMITPIGLFQWKRLPFGLSSAPSCFQSIINRILRGCDATKCLLDDIIIASDAHSHESKVHAVLSRLAEYNVEINSEKTILGVETVDFSGHTVSSSGVKPLQSNVDSFLKISDPTSLKEVQAFLGAANYYRKFVPNFAAIAEPLHQLLKKDANWTWTPECHSACDQIKAAISSNKVLAHFDSNCKTIVSTDASGTALGAVLSQIISGEERPVAFASRALSVAEQGYSASEREALACIWACEHWHYYLYGRKFLLRTDHSALVTLLSGGNKGRKPMRLLRWSERLQQYNFDIVYRSGKENSVPDVLSRFVRSESSPTDGSELNNDSLTVSAVFGCQALHTLTPIEISTPTKTDPVLIEISHFFHHGWPKKCENQDLKPYFSVKDELSIVHGSLFRENRAVIPSSLRSRVLELAHEGHSGITRTKQKLRESVWWPGIDRDTEHFVRYCEACVMSGKTAKPAVAPLKPIPFPSKPWTKLGLDILGELHDVPANFKYLLVLTDLHSKWPEVKAVTNITSHAVNAFLSEVFTRWGIPEEIITDNGRQFVSREVEDFLSGLGIKHCRTAFYHPQSNGQVELFIRVLKEGLRAAKYSGKPIDQALLSILASYRSTPHSTTGVSPSELLIGRTIRTPLNSLALTPVKRKVSFNPVVEERVFDKQEKCRQYTDKKRRAKSRSFSPGTYVRIKRPVRESKMAPVYTEPKLVLDNPTPSTVTLEDGSKWNADRIKPAACAEQRESQSVSAEAPFHLEMGEKAPIELPPNVEPPPEFADLPKSRTPPKNEPPRRSTRTRKKPARFKDYVDPSLVED